MEVPVVETSPTLEEAFASLGTEQRPTQRFVDPAPSPLPISEDLESDIEVSIEPEAESEPETGPEATAPSEPRAYETG